MDMVSKQIDCDIILFDPRLPFQPHSRTIELTVSTPVYAELMSVSSPQRQTTAGASRPHVRGGEARCTAASECSRGRRTSCNSPRKRPCVIWPHEMSA